MRLPVAIPNIQVLAVSRFRGFGENHQRHKQKIIAHYLMVTDMVAVLFFIGFRRIRGTQALAVNPSLKVGVSHQIYKQQMFAPCQKVMVWAVVRFTAG